MKPRNFPARKLIRQATAKTGNRFTLSPAEYAAARAIRTKKNRANK